MRGSLEPIVDEGYVEPELAGVRRFEPAGFEFDDDVAELLNVKEQQIDVEIIAVDLDFSPGSGWARGAG